MTTKTEYVNMLNSLSDKINYGAMVKTDVFVMNKWSYNVIDSLSGAGYIEGTGAGGYHAISIYTEQPPNFTSADIFFLSYASLTSFPVEITEISDTVATNSIDSIPLGSGTALCAIATISDGTEMIDALGPLREFRDMVLNKHKLGRIFVHSYYNRISPKLVPVLEKSKRLCMIGRTGIRILLKLVKLR